jgi:hypothetical protein
MCISALRYTYHPLFFLGIISFSTVGIYQNWLVCDLRLWRKTQLVNSNKQNCSCSAVKMVEIVCTLKNEGMHISCFTEKCCNLNLHLVYN